VKYKNIIVFAGKGGVGKTTCAAATALYYASREARTLIISTDPTPSLADIFEISSPQKPARVNEFLSLHELGPEEVKEMWDNKFGHEVYEVFSSFVAIEYPEFVDFMTSLLPGLRDEFMVDYIRNLSQNNNFDVIIWDTAPLGQTLTLLETPAMLRQHLRLAPRIYSQLKFGAKSHEPVLDILKHWEIISAKNIDFLHKEVEFRIVTIAEALAVNQLKDVFSEIGQYGLQPSALIVNHLAQHDGSEFMNTRAEEQRRYLNIIHEVASGIPVKEIPMFPGEIKGTSRLLKLIKYL
jgi:arsenite/tail-anchored protein-transporting ATPase